MKNVKILTMLVFAGLMFYLAEVGQGASMGTAFTYQGHLYDANYTADGLYDFAFKLYDANSGGGKVGSDVNKPGVDVIDGYFTVELDFGGGVFDGDARWLEIGVRAGEMNDPNAYTVLSPRQEVTPTPYALYAKSAQTAGTDNDWMVSDGNMYSIPSGNVGIGTTDPTEELEVEGTVKADYFVGDGSQLTGIKHTGAIYRWATFRTWGSSGQWAMGNRAEMFGGISPSQWTSGAYAHQMSSNKEILRTLYTRKGYGGKNAMVMSERADQYASSADAQFVTALFRIKNTTDAAINWTPYLYFTSYGSHSDYASAALNGVNIWSYTGNAHMGSPASFTLSIPPNRTSTVIFVSSSYYWYSYGATLFRDIQLGFYNNSLELPAGLEFVDDLDTATGGWEQ